VEIFKVQRRTRKLLEELDSIAIEKDRVHLIESRAEHLIASATNLIDMIRNSYDNQIAEDMERKLLLAIKRQDSTKFTNGLKRLK
tara:strand:+ start:689 stop:943 length:255 start_codon:yes stop_codon:yes gene_type:complete